MIYTVGTRDQILELLANGTVFQYDAPCGLWRDEESGVEIPRLLFRKLLGERLIKNGAAWSPEREQSVLERTRLENTEARIAFWIAQFQAAQSPAEIRELVFDIWWRASSETSIAAHFVEHQERPSKG